MRGDLRVRRYRPADAERVKELHEVALRDAGGYVEGAPEPDLRDVEDSYLDDGEFLVGEVDGTIVAMGAFRPAQGYIQEFLGDLEGAAEVKRLRVDPRSQRSGYGQRIYDELEDSAREDGFREFVLDTTAAQAAARGFFDANGFEQVHSEEVQFEEQSFTLLFSRKAL